MRKKEEDELAEVLRRVKLLQTAVFELSQAVDKIDAALNPANRLEKR